ncbi:MAG: acetyl-CoA carboxylase biotin carboxylase subunit [Deltaproteobacteria bacterium]|nr:acetyl-CoA carboxylase biotin carboxylase subunit [Deltaproteobacteria bacterium]
MRRISKILVANRGEIAVRVMDTAHAMGIATVAVFSDADAGAPFTRKADEAVRIGPAPSRDSYLRIERIIEAAQRTRADAVHPGYGFLSENAAFAEACSEAGLIFIGPPATAIRAMGKKREAKQIARQAGVPVIPGYEGPDQSDARMLEAARELGFPVLIKASAGGGGKGMRVARNEGELIGGLASARREAESAFGDGTLLLERYLDRPRHIEIQILGDQHGNLVHLFERECSIQRRHQKIIEETPSTIVEASLREKMGAAAVALGKAIGYFSAGTVEFMVDAERRFYFLEVNTRLQVEHPVTEEVVGVDLVKEMIRIARGEKLSFTQGELRQSGAAIECRLYAEDPANEFLPASGRLFDFSVPAVPGLRVDSGVESGSEISIHYDPLLAKVISFGQTRVEATERMRRGLSLLGAQGIRTNRSFLLQILEHPAFALGEIDTGFIDRHFADAKARAPRVDADLLRESAIGAVLGGFLARQEARAVLPGLTPGFRNNPFQNQRVELETEDGQPLTVEYRARDRRRLQVVIGAWTGEVAVLAVDGVELSIEESGRVYRLRVISTGDRWLVQGARGALSLVECPRFPDRDVEHDRGACVAPMPGRVSVVAVEVGRVVHRGTVLVVLEAMKMEHPVAASADGVVREVRVAVGDQVAADAVLVVVEPGSPS